MTDRRPLELDDLYDLRRVGEPTVSPDGERVAFTVSEANEDEDTWHDSLYVAPTDGRREPHRLTRLPGAGSPKWSPDGSALAFLAARDRDIAFRVGRDGEDAADPDDDAESDGTESDEDGESNGADEDRPQVWVFDLERGGDARQITDFEEGASAFDWGPDGDRLVVAARDPTADELEYLERRREEDGPIETERLQHKRDGRGWLDTVTTYLFVVDRETREATRLDDAHGGGAMESLTGLDPTWSTVSDRIAFLSNRTDRPDDTAAMHVYTVAPDGSELRQLTGGNLMTSDLRWSPDGSRLAAATQSASNWYETSEMSVIDADTGDHESVSGSLDRTLAWAGTHTWIDEETLLVPVGDEARTRLVRLSVEGEPERVYDEQGEYRNVEGFDAAGGTAAFFLSAPDEAPELYTVSTDELDGNAASDPARHLTDLNAGLVERIRTPDCERIRFRNSDDEEIEGIVYLPSEFDADDSDALPLVVDIHGGPMSYDSPSFGFKETYWTGRGYAVLQVNYRGSTSYGQAFSEQIRADWGPRESDDIVSGARELVARGWADPDRLFVTGFSQGGINTLYVITRTDEFAAAAPEHGIYDFYALYGTNDVHIYYASDLGVPWENPENYRSISSIQDVDEVETPTLVTAGEEDWRCPPWQAEQLYVRLKKRGVPSKLVLYTGVHHDSTGDPGREIHRLRTLTEWFERYDPEIDRSATDE